MKRREFLTSAAVAATGLYAAASTARSATMRPSRRPPVGQRRSVSAAVEKQIHEISAQIADPEVAWMFQNCFPNPLDTTVEFSMAGGKPDTFVITGDIPAMWLRDTLPPGVAGTPRQKDYPEYAADRRPHHLRAETWCK